MIDIIIWIIMGIVFINAILGIVENILKIKQSNKHIEYMYRSTMVNIQIQRDLKRLTK